LDDDDGVAVAGVSFEFVGIPAGRGWLRVESQLRLGKNRMVAFCEWPFNVAPTMRTRRTRLREVDARKFVGAFSKIFFCGLAAVSLCSPIARADIIYVANQGNNTVLGFDNAGSQVVLITTGINHPLGLAVDSVGNLFVGNGNDNSITKITPQGVASVFATGLSEPLGLAFDSSGNLYAANSFNNTILKFNQSGMPSLFANTGLNKPVGLAFDSSGNLYAANAGNNTIVKFNPSGTPSVFANTSLVFPRGLAFDRAGNLYAANADDTIVRFDTTGSPSLFASTGLDSPVGLAFDGIGNLYAANDDNNTIVKFDTTGSPSLFASAGLNFPYLMAIQVIPEPSSSALLVTGVFVAMATIRFRKR
jgi:hypothetical protein